jgi:hypothetical protein
MLFTVTEDNWTNQNDAGEDLAVHPHPLLTTVTGASPKAG